MSASLVGSEMCIRDSGPAPGRRPWRAARRRRPWSRKCPGDQARDEPGLGEFGRAASSRRKLRREAWTS
eukprot:5803142-Alexandrium_andersonii.AAC.1